MKNIFQNLEQKKFFNNKDSLKNDRGIKQEDKILIFLTSLIITALLLGFRQIGGLQIWELEAYDLMVRWSSVAKKDPKLLVVEITDTDIENQNRWPLSDRTFAILLQKLQQYKPKVIGLDIYRDISHNPGHEALTEELKADNVIAIEYLGNGQNRVSPPNEMDRERIGFNDLVVDIDNIIRRNLMYARLPDRELYSFGLRVSLKYLGIKEDRLQIKDNSLQIDKAIIPRLNSNSGNYKMDSTEAVGWQTLLNYRSHDIAEKITLTEVLEGKLDPNLIKDKVVLIGATAPSIKDLVFYPYDGLKKEIPGVMIHAHAASQIISIVRGESHPFWFWSEAIEILWIGGWSIIGAFIIWRGRTFWTLALSNLGVIICLFGISWFLFIRGGWIPLIPPILSFILTGSSLLIYKAIRNIFYDAVTGLPNNILFINRLRKLQKNKKPHCSVILFYLDINRFQEIKEGLGYEVADRILIDTKRIIKQNFDRGILGIVGDSKFAIAFTEKKDSCEAIEIASQLKKKIKIPFLIGENISYTNMSIGVAVDTRETNLKPEELLNGAQTAMYQSLASGKTEHQVFTPQMHEKVLEQLKLEADLSTAIKEREFTLYYQPIISLKTGKIAGFESLVRWQSEVRGFVSPGAFIPCAETTGLIVPLGEWILQEACSQMANWLQKIEITSSLFMSVNLSGKQFSQPNLLEKIEGIMATSGLNPHNLKLEITESMLMDNIEEAIELLKRLKDRGIKISMDDFGTGFSSFSYLHRFPMDTLKVDRSFVMNMTQGKKNKEIVKTIINLADNLNMDVIAEGIETELEQKILSDFNCEYGQGYFFARPLPAKDATELLVNNKQWKVDFTKDLRAEVISKE